MRDRPSIQRFELLAEVGRGAMGIVYQAHDPQLDRDVALKVLSEPSEPVLGELASRKTIDLREPSAENDLLREARIMARLSHPNIVPVYEVGMEGTRVFVVMEHVPGCDLLEWLREPRSPDAIATVFAQAGRGLAAAHERGIVHRDFKLENVLIGVDGRVRVADFGLSKLVVQAANMVRVEERGGTPKYMAPELWRGEPATSHSDVFAFCTALREALGEPVLQRRGIAELVHTGLSESPSTRPTIETIVRALERNRRWRRTTTVVVGATFAVAIAAGAAVWGLRSQGDASDGCSDRPDLLADGWNPTLRDALGHVLAAKEVGGASPTVPRILGELDGRRADLAQQGRAVCEAEHHGDLAPAQARVRSSCLVRRAIEIGALVHQVITDPHWTLSDADMRFAVLHGADECVDLEAPAMTASRAAVAALYDRYVTFRDGSPAAQLSRLEPLETDAIAAGESELATRVALTVGDVLHGADQLAASDEAFERASKRAIVDHDVNEQAVALVQRSGVALDRGDHPRGETYAKLALDLADRPTTPIRTRAEVLLQVGRADLASGNYPPAIDLLRKGLALVDNGGPALTLVHINLIRSLTNGLLEVNQVPEAIETANRGLQLVRATVGERSDSYVQMLWILGRAREHSNDLEGAIDVRKQALTTALAIYPPSHSEVVDMRTALADDLLWHGDYESARREFAAALQQTADNPALRKNEPWFLSELALATFDLGHYDEAMQLMNRSVEMYASRVGADDPNTLAARVKLADLELDLGKLDEASHQLDDAQNGYRAHSLPDDRRPAELRGSLVAQLALARGRPQQAEALARAALAELGEEGAHARNRCHVLWTLASSLVAEGRYAEAREPQAQAAELRRKVNATDDVTVLDELVLAEIDEGLGDIDDAVSHASHVRDVLDRIHSQPKARREVQALLARLSKRHRAHRSSK